MMTAEVVQLAPAGRDRRWPLLVPRVLFTRYQPVVGAQATLIWINLYEMAEGGVTSEFMSVRAALSDRLRVSSEETETAATALEQAGLLQRSGGRWTVLWPAEHPQLPETPAYPADGPEASTGSEPSAAVPETVTATPDAAAPDLRPAAADSDSPQFPPIPDDGDSADAVGWNSDEAALQAVVQFYQQRIGMLGPSQFEKLRFWVEEQGMSSDVVALAIEETVQSAQTPRIAYVEGVLRNWYNEGIRTLDHLQKSKRARSREVTPTTEGTPNADSFAAIDGDAVRRWKEMYADEYDD